MNIVMLLAPFSIGLGLLAVGAFWWTLRAGQYDDPKGDAERILIDDPEDLPAPADPDRSRARPGKKASVG
ncbi:cbb3-type cytochrome oxidase assembly protein CcoS [Phenylobacterium sp.]|jgi:cbb3-type cytochrome oxidase maturation protein|uniref:cbb3-type cytochrome oxidase assembly protein CcoS n=1 Tax=Phenylobacterium sp. TaxID=1871053 RepID=UPI0037C7FB9A